MHGCHHIPTSNRVKTNFKARQTRELGIQLLFFLSLLTILCYCPAQPVHMTIFNMIIS